MQAKQLQKSQPQVNRQQSNSSLKFYGNKDEKKEYAFNPEFVDHYLVRHSKFEKLASGAQVEDPRSIHYQFYEEAIFEKMSAQKVVDGKQEPSSFDAMGITVTILHDPTIIN